MRQAAWIGIVGGTAAVAAAFLPWMTAVGFYGTINRNSLQMGANLSFSWDGLAVIFLGVVGVAIGLSRVKQFRMPSGLASSSIIPGLALLALVVYDGIKISQWVTDHPAASLGIGYGVYIAGAGGIAVLVSGVMLRRLDQVRAAPP